MSNMQSVNCVYEQQSKKKNAVCLSEVQTSVDHLRRLNRHGSGGQTLPWYLMTSAETQTVGCMLEKADVCMFGAALQTLKIPQTKCPLTLF